MMKLPRDVLADSLLGQTRNWSDPRIVEDNGDPLLLLTAKDRQAAELRLAA
jgi:hypothetical protein